MTDTCERVPIGRCAISKNDKEENRTMLPCGRYMTAAVTGSAPAMCSLHRRTFPTSSLDASRQYSALHLRASQRDSSMFPPGIWSACIFTHTISLCACALSPTKKAIQIRESIIDTIIEWLVYEGDLCIYQESPTWEILRNGIPNLLIAKFAETIIFHLASTCYRRETFGNGAKLDIPNRPAAVVVYLS